MTMGNLDYFKKFISSDPLEVKSEIFVWIYTRVSSKEQFEKNSSVDNQLAANRDFAVRSNYRVTEEFGGTYESAKSDFTRKEFKRLIDRVESSRKRPYAILVYKMSRFSRSGGNAIGLVNRLVDELGVHLIEVSTALSTTTERGKAAIYESLFHAYKENLERKEIIIPSMKAYLEKGNRLGTCPQGYDHYGPRVRNEKFFQKYQKIEVNKEGQLIKKAWQWKVSGLYSDAQIISKLASYGLKILPQKLSKIWRNPFYCGININKLLGEPKKGNWEPLVSEKDFIKVQQLLEGNPSGYQHKKDEESRPLSRLLKCYDCGSYMIGYKSKKKNIHYYRCSKCRGVNLNAQTTPKSQRRGANDLFIDLLSQYSLPESLTPLVELQLTKMFNHYQKDHSDDEQSLEFKLKKLEQKKKELTIRHGLGELDKETFELTSEHLIDQIQAIYTELNTVPRKLLNLRNLIIKSLETLKKLSVLWGSGDLECRRIIQKTVFPEGVFYNAEKHECWTKKINGFVLVIRCILQQYALNKNGNFHFLDENSRIVAVTGHMSNHFLEDLERLAPQNSE